MAEEDFVHGNWYFIESEHLETSPTVVGRTGKCEKKIRLYIEVGNCDNSPSARLLKRKELVCDWSARTLRLESNYQN